MSSKRVLSLIQPTGDIHFGNYFGAVQNWVKLQEQYDCVFGIADYHAITMPYSPAKLRQNIWDLSANLIACGIKPETLFIQSLIPEHAELGWILGCFASHGRLAQMTQFKDKSSKVSEGGKDSYISCGLFTYPVLQSADILIYKANCVPVGKDQEQHLELVRSIAARFNNQVGKEYFEMPEPLFTEIPKVMSTADPTRKMSKSAGEKHYIKIFEDPNRIRKQIKSAVTDTGEPTEGMSPGVENLFSLLRACGEQDNHDTLMNDYNNGVLKYSSLKEVVGEALVSVALPIQERKASIKKKEVKDMLKSSSYEIRKKAQETLKEVKELAGLINVRF